MMSDGGSDFAYSYHTFMFPFIWNDNGNIGMDEFAKALSKKHWFDISWGEEKIPSKYTGVTDEQYKRDYLLDYASSQYFTAAARDMVFNIRGDNVTRLFEFRYDGRSIRNEAKYVITKTQKYTRICEKYELIINGIKLNLYNTGVAIITFELEYHGTKVTDGKPGASRAIDDVNKINEHGRRISYPYWPGEGMIHDLVADRIDIIFSEKVFSELFSENSNDLQKNFELYKSEVSLTYVMDPITQILELDSGFKLTSLRGKKESGNLFIQPCIDDRMFVCCLVSDPEFAGRIKGDYAEKKEYAYLGDCGDSVDDECDIQTVSSELYRFLFIENSSSCNSATMRHELLNDCVNNRWINWGTVYGVTHHSFVCVTGLPDKVQYNVINPFLTIYVHMARIALAQRATLLALQAEASALAEGLSMDGVVSVGQLGQISTLHEKFVKAQNQILLYEITAQEQGVELFDKLQSQLNIGCGKDELNNQLKNLYSIANINIDKLRLEAEQREALADRMRDNTLYRVGFVALFWAIVQVLPEIINVKKLITFNDIPIVDRIINLVKPDGLVLMLFAFGLTIIVRKFVRRKVPGSKKRERRNRKRDS